MFNNPYDGYCQNGVSNWKEGEYMPFYISGNAAELAIGHHLLIFIQIDVARIYNAAGNMNSPPGICYEFLLTAKIYEECQTKQS